MNERFAAGVLSFLAGCATATKEDTAVYELGDAKYFGCDAALMEVDGCAIPDPDSKMPYALAVEVMNVGNGVCKAMDVDFILNETPQTELMKSLEVGESVWVKTEADLAPGTHYLVASIDHANQVPELDEVSGSEDSNNMGSEVFTILEDGSCSESSPY